MYKKKISKDFQCGIVITMEILGGKWKPCLIRKIYNGIKRPNELHRQYPAASPRVLNQQLTELVNHGIIEKKVYPILPYKVEYYLTEVGLSLLPLIHQIEKWGLANSGIISM